jgi:hypothetical protein
MYRELTKMKKGKLNKTVSHLASNIFAEVIYTITYCKWLQSCYLEFVPVCLHIVQYHIVHKLQELLNDDCRQYRILSQYRPTLNHRPTDIHISQTHTPGDLTLKVFTLVRANITIF